MQSIMYPDGPHSTRFIIPQQGTPRIDSTLPGFVADTVPRAAHIQRDQLRFIAWLLDLGFDSFVFLKFREKSRAEA